MKTKLGVIIIKEKTIGCRKCTQYFDEVVGYVLPYLLTEPFSLFPRVISFFLLHAESEVFIMKKFDAGLGDIAPLKLKIGPANPTLF